MKSFRQIRNESRGIEPAPVMVVAGNPNVVASAKERKRGGKVKRTKHAAMEMTGAAVRQRADRPRRAVGGQLQALPPALAPSGVGGTPYQIAGGQSPWGLARGGMTKRRRSENIREGDSIRPRATMED